MTNSNGVYKGGGSKEATSTFELLLCTIQMHKSCVSFDTHMFGGGGQEARAATNLTGQLSKVVGL